MSEGIKMLWMGILMFFLCTLFVSCAPAMKGLVKVHEGLITVSGCTISTTGCVINNCGEYVAACAADNCDTLGLSICLMSRCSIDVGECIKKIEDIVK